jgi:hypothetical protein
MDTGGGYLDGTARACCSYRGGVVADDPVLGEGNRAAGRAAKGIGPGSSCSSFRLRGGRRCAMSDGKEARAGMTGIGDGESSAAIVEEHLGRTGLEVKLDKGFAQGTYAAYVEYDDLAARVGFAAARKKAGEYCALLKEQLGRTPAYTLRKTEDGSRTGDPRRKRDLEATFLSFAVETGDGRFHDEAVRKDFRLALLRANQAWDQAQAKAQDQRRSSRQDRFRVQLAELLGGEAYAHLDGATKERLLSEVPALAFRPRGVER